MIFTISRYAYRLIQLGYMVFWHHCILVHRCISILWYVSILLYGVHEKLISPWTLQLEEWNLTGKPLVTGIFSHQIWCEIKFNSHISLIKCWKHQNFKFDKWIGFEIPTMLANILEIKHYKITVISLSAMHPKGSYNVCFFVETISKQYDSCKQMDSIF